MLGSFSAFVHAVWIILVALGWAGPLLSFILRVHFIDTTFSIADFSFGNAIMLIVITAVIGYAVGIIIGTFWNLTCKEIAPEEYVVDKGY